MTDDLKLVEKLENLLVVMQLTHQHFNTAELLPCIALARIGAAVKPRPISEAAIDTDQFIAYIDIHNNKTNETITEAHLIWLSEDTGEIADDCEQGWRLEDYHSFIPLSALHPPEQQEAKP